MTNEDALPFMPDDDVTDIEQHINDLIRRLRAAGRTDDALTVTGSAATLRNTSSTPLGRGRSDVFAALDMIRKAASEIQRIIIESFSDEMTPRCQD